MSTALLPMYDSVVGANIPENALVAAGYIDVEGNSYFAIRQLRPKAKDYSISTTGIVGANWFDFENGTMSLTTLINACRQSVAKGYETGVYTTPSNWNTQVAPALRKLGIYDLVNWWCAWWGSFDAQLVNDAWGRPSVAHQYSPGGPYDTSVISAPFVFPPVPKPKPGPVPVITPPTCVTTPVTGENMNNNFVEMSLDGDGNGAVVLDGGAIKTPGVTSMKPAIPWSEFIAATAQAGFPPENGYWEFKAAAGEYKGFVLLQITGGKPHSKGGAWVLAAT